MTDVPKLLEGLAAVAWPAIVVLLIILFRPAVAAVIESARSRKFTLKLGGQELTMEEASQQQRNLIADLQAQVVDIRKRMETSVLASPQEPIRTTMLTSTTSVLWVDDQPKNNSYFVQQLTDKGVTVDLALSTAEGLRLFEKKSYVIVISDMGRTEEAAYKPTAGIEFLRQIRESNKTVPFIVFCSAQGAKKNRKAAMSLGATAITSSPTEMFGILQTTFGDKA